jgi:hypothetical protein
MPLIETNHSIIVKILSYNPTLDLTYLIIVIDRIQPVLSGLNPARGSS